ncbi:MAG: hypothetical protein C5B46_04135 [Proteobacteria bacterium]|nr:MAG: hypothetical protein C5B46_04135 [Pseudomonadota bacterium]
MEERRMTVYLNDGSQLVFEFPQQAGEDPTTVAANVRKALEWNRLALEVEGSLVIVPIASIKYLRLSPVPMALPEGEVIRNVRLVE